MNKKFICTKTEPVVETKYGKLRGFFYDGVYNFWGVRYGKAKRFHMPEEQESWEGVRDALAYGYVTPLLSCPVPNNELTVPHRYWPEGEDCLNLNIATPTIDRGAKKPVMVWFHGGGFSDGSGIAHIAFEGDNAARNHDVVMVCVNHRLNVFGFLDLSSFGEQYENSGNAGIADLVAALKWVHGNIEAFGGDPGNVTIFGQSGGGGKVNCMGQCPAADGLFQKAIVMSGVFARSHKGVVDYPKADERELVLEILKQLGLKENEVEKLEKVNFRLFILAVNRALAVFGRQGKTVGWGPHKNDYFLGDPMDYGFRQHFKDIPMIIGSTLGEFGDPSTAVDKAEMTEEQKTEAVRAKYGENTDELLKLYREAYPDKNLAYAGFLDNMVRRGSVAYAKAKSEGQHAPIWSYLLAATFDFDSGMPAWHNSDIPFVFGNGRRIQYCCATENSEELCDLMPAAFSAFAHTGDPNFEGLPAWAPADSEHVPTILFDDKIEVKTDHDEKLMAFLAEHTPPMVFGHRAPKTEEDEGTLWKY